MSKVRILNHETIKEVLDMKQVIEAVEKVYALKSSGETDLFPMVFYEFERGKADMDIKSGYLKRENIYGLKLVSWFGENAVKGLPLLYGTTIIFDSGTGKPIGILNAEHVTGMRTGAAGAIGAKYLARKCSENLLMVGTGHQAAFQIAATLIVMDNIRNVRVYSPTNHDKAKAFCNVISEKLEKDFLSRYNKGSELFETIRRKFNANFEAVSNIEEAAGKSDVIITATPARSPLIMREWVRKGTHISCVGADMEGKQEIDENIFSAARVFVDDMNQAINVGESELPIKKGVISKADIIAEIGDVILGKAVGRTCDDDITIYDTTGIALQDLMTSKLALDIAYEKGLGQEVEL